MVRNIIIDHLSNSEQETQQVASRFAEQLEPGSIVAFYGDLGAGKTTFIKALIRRLTQTPFNEMQRPTFTYFHIFDHETPIYHFDLYRLKTEDDFIALGFTEYLEDPSAITLIEWSEKIEKQLPKKHYKVELSYRSLNTRQMIITQNLSYENV